MKRYIPIEIPTKKYIKAYLINEFGERPVMNSNTPIGSKLIDLLQHQFTSECEEIDNIRYDARVKLFISKHTFLHRGAFITKNNLKVFNIFCTRQIKERFRFAMDFYFEVDPSFTTNLPYVRKQLGIEIESWDDDSMKKDYYRYRKATGKPLLYKRLTKF